MEQTVEDKLLDKLLLMRATVRESEVVAPCPICQPDEDNDARYKMIIGPGKDHLMICFCRNCGNNDYAGKCGHKEWWSLVCHYYEFSDWHNDSALTPKEIWSRLKLESGIKKKLPTAHPDLLHKVYTDLLSRFTLHDNHKKWLSKRGIDPDWAVANGYRSSEFVTTNNDFSYIRLNHPNFVSLYDTFGSLLKSVPGFSHVDIKGQIGIRADAILTPCRDFLGRIQAIKQRMLDGKATRMRWLASHGKEVPSVVNSPHFPVGVGHPNKWKEVWITEGERKADCHWLLTKNPTIGITGTGCYKQAINCIRPMLEKEGRVVIAFDMDTAGKKATEKLLPLLMDKYKVAVAEWTVKKGIDDAVVAKLEVKVVDQDRNSNSEIKVDSPPKSNKLRDSESVIEWLRIHGPTVRSEIPAVMAVITKMINQKLLNVTFTDKGQVLYVSSAALANVAAVARC